MTRSYATTPEMNMAFDGAKLALLVGRHIISVLRDDRVDIPWPGRWDLPGGGREGCEIPVDCALRETREEVGLQVAPEAIFWGRRFVRQGRANWFFAARLDPRTLRDITFGGEGQGWALMQIPAFLDHPRAVPHFQDRLRICLEEGKV